MRSSVAIVYLLLKVFTFSLAQLDDRTELHVAFITSFGGEYDSSVAVPAVRLAASKINENKTMLSDYKLVVELVESGTVAKASANSNCDFFDSQRTFLKQVTAGQTKLALIGCGCSLATERVAVSSNFWNITHISYTPNSDRRLSNRRLFPNVWKTYASASNLHSPMVAILRQYSWSKVKIITQDEDLFRESTDNLVRELTALNVTVDMNGTTLFFTRSNVSKLSESELFSEEIRVYFLNMYPTHARRIMCKAAYNHRTDPNPEHHYPGYVWLTLGWYGEDWWRERVANDTLQCSDKDLEPFIRNTIAVQLGNSSSIDAADSTTDVGLTTDKFEEEIKEMADYRSSGFGSTAYHAYDALWTLAFGIERSLQSLEDEGLYIEDFSYNDTAQRITSLISEQLKQPDFAFIGVSGEVRFDENGTRVSAPAKVFKYDGGNTTQNICRRTSGFQRYLIATDDNSTLVYTGCDNDSTVWPDGVPSDGTPIVVLTTIFTPLYVVYDIAVVFGLAFATFCLCFNFLFRKRKIVRMISPNLNYIIILGGIFLYLSVIFFVFPTTNPLLVTFACHIRIWLQGLGYFMCFGTIVAKMWRIYFIFYHPRVKITNAKQMIVKDWHLSMIVVAMCIVVVIIDTAVAIWGQYQAVQVQDFERPVTRNEDNVLLAKHNLVCQGPRDLIWIIVLYAYILLTQLFAVILAFKTRKVEIEILNDAKYVALIIYITSIVLVIMIVCAILLSNYLNADGAVFGGLLHIFTTTVLMIVFIPKMISLYKDPKGENVFKSQMGSQDTGITLNTTLPANQNGDKNGVRSDSFSLSYSYSVKVTNDGHVHVPPAIEEETETKTE